MFSTFAESLRQSADAGAKSAELALQRIPVAAGLAAEDISQNLGGSVKLFQDNLAASNTEFFKTSDQAAKVAALEADISAKVGEQTTARAATNEQLTLTGTAAEKLVQLEQAIAAAQAAGNTELATKLERTGELLAKEAQAEAQANASKETKREIVALETELNLAKAAGNEEAVKALEKEIETKKAKEEIKKLTEDYINNLGVDADEAGRLATNFVNAKNAAASIGDKTVNITVNTTVNDAPWKNLLAEINNTPSQQTINVALAVTGASDLSGAKAVLENMGTINKNYQATFTATGTSSIEEIKNKIGRAHV